MSSLAPNNDHAARRLAAQRVRTAARTRRADEGTVTEMARLLLRDAREAHPAGGRIRQGGAAGVQRAGRRELTGASERLSWRPLAARRA
jgi:hypothetical protein